MPSIDEILKKSGDPALAHRQWEELQRVLKKPPPRFEILASVLGNSRPLVHHWMQHPSDVAEICKDPTLLKPKGRGQVLQELTSLFDRHFKGEAASAMEILRHYKRRESSRIAARDLSGTAPFEEIGREMAALADGIIEFAYRAAHRIHEPRRPPADFVVIGLGKLGAEDLNFSSDVDLIYLRGADPRELFTRMGETMTRILQERTGDGFAFRVDLGLRPEGKAGELVPPLDAMAHYYETAADPWEHAALTRARFVAGSEPMGEGFLKAIQSLIFHRYRDAAIVRNLKEIKQKIRQQLVTKGFHVKLGDGGIREIEFFLQAFQLLYGGETAALREKHPLRILDAIQSLGIVPPQDLQGLREAYIFLRRIENHLQRVDDQQVHSIPEDLSERTALVRRMDLDSPESFHTTLEGHRNHVRRCFEELLPH